MITNTLNLSADLTNSPDCLGPRYKKSMQFYQETETNASCTKIDGVGLRIGSERMELTELLLRGSASTLAIIAMQTLGSYRYQLSRI